MSLKNMGKKYPGIQLSPWIIMGAVAILLVIVVVLAIENYNREKRYMSHILSEKGAALIKSFEAGAHTGMMGMMWGGEQAQHLLVETARQSDILYLMVTDEMGRILAHSDPARIGQSMGEGYLKGLVLADSEHWRVIEEEEGRRSFEVYRYFLPLREASQRPSRSAPFGCDMMMGGRSIDWCTPSGPDGSRRIIFIGLDVEPFESARKEDIRNTIVISSILVLLGFGGLLSLFLAQSYRTTRRMLQDTSAFANEVVSNLPVGLIATDADGRIAFFNTAAEGITGTRLHEALGKTLQEAFSPLWCDLKDSLHGGQTILEEEMECTFSGKAVPLSVSATRIVNEEGDFVGHALILRDLGEVRRLQAEVRRKEKLAALGGLAAGVAHEIRNPLSSIKGLASYFAGKFRENSEDREAATIMVQEVDRLNRVVTELLDFARPSELSLKPVDLHPLLEHSLRLIQQDAKLRKVETHYSPLDGLPPVLVDADRVTQCLLNLYLNAIQAMHEGGHLFVRAGHAGDGKIRVEIEDTGRGIRPDDLPKIFDPYFTTKPSGTGLGLAVVHKIIEAHQGDIKVRSAVGKGTVFTVFLPTGTNGEKRL